MDLQLENQVAVVVGGANGIGLAIVEAFAGEGAHVAILDIDAVAAQDAAARLNQESRRALAIRLDVTEEQEFAATASQVGGLFSQIDHLIYAAGAGSGKLGFPFWNLQPADWPRVIDINLQGAVRFLTAFQPALTSEREDKAFDASVLLISSIAGQVGSQTDPPYSAAKAALLNFMQCAARDFAAWNVRVNAICPGMVKTTLNRSVWRAWQAASPENRLSYDEWADDKIGRIAPLGRWQTTDEVAATSVFLASPHARNITGQAINVDGGQVMH